MRFNCVLLGLSYFMAVATAQVYNGDRNEVPILGPYNRRQYQQQQHILNDLHQHHRPLQQQQPQQQSQQQQFFVPGTEQQQQQRRQAQVQQNGNNNFPQNYQFTRSAQNQLRLPQQQQQQYSQQQNLDIHQQNFLTLRNFGNNQQIGPQQALPQRSFNNKPFQNQQQSLSQLPILPQPQPQQSQQQQQYSTLPNSIHQKQINYVEPQTQQKLPNILPVPTFQSNAAENFQNQFSTAPQSNFFQNQNLQQHQQQQQQQQQQQYQQRLPIPQTVQQQQSQPTFYQQNNNLPPQQQQQQQLPQVTPTLGLPVPKIFQQVQSTSFPFPQQQQQQQQSLPIQQQQAQQQQQQQRYVEQFPSQAQQNPEQEYKQKLIQKHEQFVQKQYEKSQSKVRQQHEEFLAKQEVIKHQILPTLLNAPQQQQQQQQSRYQQINSPNSRPVDPSQLQHFSSAVQKYYEEHPTTTTTTTTTTTEAPITNKPNKNVYAQGKTELNKYGQKTNHKKSIKTIARDDLLKQLKAALAESSQKDLGDKNYDEMDLVLPSGERVSVIRTTDPNLVKGNQAITQEQLQTLISGQQKKNPPAPMQRIVQQSAPGGVDLSSLASLYGGEFAGISNGANSIASSAVIQSDSDEPPSLEELAKRGLIPEGYEIEGLSSSKPTPEPPVTMPAKKKATYVYLEEQADGSFKIQGVKANGEKETKQTGAEVESILERIRNGEINLPPSVSRLTLPNDEVVEIKNGKIVRTINVTPPSSTQAQTTTTTATTTPKPTNRYLHPSRTSTAPRTSPIYATTSTPLIHRSSTSRLTEYSPSSDRVDYSSSTTSIYASSTPANEADDVSETVAHYADALVQETEHNDKASETNSSNSLSPSEDLLQILKTNGLFAMAKYLKQSGLDTILNETGPYTIFVPTDKAFKNLLVQLGGPERAEEKFKANPRLLSGLLLHHVIPGAFEIATLQDEMTGVSLAGTQLRVNQYTMHDQEWNDVTVTTINGAMVLLNKKDITIPQGVAHAVDRVMFPLPVGDLLQTLQSDRENRFTNFLKILYTSGFSEKLENKGTKTYTVFAPTDKSFTDFDSDTLEKLFNDKTAAEEFAMKHIVSGTLFSAGMRFYQVKDSLFTGKTVILQKTSSGRIKAGESQIVTANIPATNGVIQAIDGILT